jgi:hypothetical protein
VAQPEVRFRDFLAFCVDLLEMLVFAFNSLTLG